MHDAIGPTDPVRVTAERPAAGAAGNDDAEPAQLAPGPVVLVDGVCNVCEASVRFLMARDPHGRLRYAALQGETAAALAAELPDLPTDLRTVVLVEPDPATGALAVRTRSDAGIRALEIAGWRPWLVKVARLVPRPVRDLVYRFIATNRYRIAGKKDACRIPSAEERGRLLP